MSVVVVDEIGDESFELAAVPDERSVEQFAAQRADPTLGERVRDWGPDRRLEDLEPFGSKYLVEAPWDSEADACSVADSIFLEIRQLRA